MSKQRFEDRCAALKQKWGDKFVKPNAPLWQQTYYGENIRVEVVSPYGERRRGTVTMTGGWRPSMLLLHRRNASGSWDLLTDQDVLVAVIGTRSKRVEVEHDKLQVAVYTGECIHEPVPRHQRSRTTVPPVACDG